MTELKEIAAVSLFSRGLPVPLSNTIIPSPGVPALSFEELNAHPHETYRTYRGKYPFVRREDGAFLVLRHHDVQVLFSDPRTRQVETELLAARGLSSGPMMDFASNSMLFSNGDAHRRRRQPLVKSFSFRMMAGLRLKVRSLAADLLNRMSGGSNMKLRDDYAALIPAITVAGILGIPRSDVPLFTSMAYQVSKMLTTSWGAADVPQIEAAIRDLAGYVEDLIAERRRHPNGDFLSDYVSKVDEVAEMSAIEAVMQIVTVILGGSDTTRAAIVVQAGLLLERPPLWQSICRNPDLIVPAVAESLRYEPAVGSVPRLATEDIILDGHLIPRGSPIILCTLSSMRDPDFFPSPDEFDLLREQPRWHPAFGGGAHRCLGEALAKIELEEALATLIAFCPQLRLADQRLRIHGHAAIRKVDELEVRWT